MNTKISPANPGRLIALIDDDLSMRTATDSFLQSYGYSVAMFSAAKAFLQSSDLDTVACVITDVRMPTMGGIELQSQLRRRGNNVPFIFVTAFPEEAVRAQAFREGATGFLTKPFDGPTLIKYVELALATKRGA